jgi:hypothetical protein
MFIRMLHDFFFARAAAPLFARLLCASEKLW